MLLLQTLLQAKNSIEQAPKENSNINVVFMVILIILIGLLGYVFYVDRKISKLGKKN
ncbi:MAG: CcmD family protein [Chitinophagaceae bacterium]